MARGKQQSAIREVRDQLFLDTAEGAQLNVVTSNLGLNRPAVGLDDDEWRAAAKAIALQPKLIRNAFRSVLEVCLGPQKSRIAVLDFDMPAGTPIIQVDDGSNLLQLGTLVISPGQVNEETIPFCFRDLVSGKVFLTAALANAHIAVASASGHLLAEQASGAATLTLISTKTFPTAGFPYSIILGQGTATEEVVVVTGNDTVLNELSLLNPTTITQPGPESTFLSKSLAEDAPDGRILIKLGTADSRVFGASGFIRVAFGLGGEETREFESNDVENNILFLRRPLENDHFTGETVELVTPGSTVETCSVLQQGVGWDIHEAENHKVKITFPEQFSVLGLRDASWLHDEVPPAHATTLAAPVIASDLILEVVDISGFPDEAGLILIDGTLQKFYIFRDEGVDELHLTTPIGSVFPGGTSVSLIRNVYAGTNLEDGNLRDLAGVLLDGQWPGPYLFDPSLRAPSQNSSFLTVAVPDPTRLVVGAVIGQTCLEVVDVVSWPASPFSPFDVRVGRGSGDEEDNTVVDRTLRHSASTTVNILPVPNPGASMIQGVDTTSFPESSNGINPARYRIIVDRGGANEEILTVTQNSAAAAGDFTLEAPTTVAHLIGETIELLADVLTLDPLVEPHAGVLVNPSKLGVLVEPLVDELEVDDGSQFVLENGTVYLNFGKERINVRQRIVSQVSPVILEMSDSSLFPPAAPATPYPIIVGEGLPTQEFALVIGNNTGTNELTLLTALVGSFSFPDYVKYVGGTPTAISFEDRAGDTLLLSNATIFPSGYEAGTAVVSSLGLSLPSTDGKDYAFLLPPDPAACLSFLVDLVRGAGIEVQFIERISS